MSEAETRITLTATMSHEWTLVRGRKITLLARVAAAPHSLMPVEYLTSAIEDEAAGILAQDRSLTPQPRPGAKDLFPAEDFEGVC